MALHTPLIFFILLLVWRSSILAFRYSFFLFLKCLLALHLTWFRLSTLLWFGSCNHCILACFLWSKNCNSSSNHSWCCFNSYRPRPYLAEVSLLSLMFSQALFVSSVSFKFSKAANLSWDLNLLLYHNFSSHSFLRLPLHIKVLCLFVYLLPFFP